MKKLSFLILIVLSVFKIYATNIDSLFEVAKKTRDIEKRTIIYLKIIDSLYMSDSLYSNVIDSLMELSQNIEKDTILAKIYLLDASYQNYLGNYDSARAIVAKSIDIYTSLNDTMNLAATWGEKGNSYCYEGIYDKCLQCFLKSLEYTEKLNYPKFLALSLNNIGNVYYYLDQKQKALDYFKRSFLIYSKIDFDYGIALSANNIGSMFLEQGNLDSAYYYFVLSMENAKKVDFLDQLAETNANISNVFYQKKQYKKAEIYAKNAIKYYKAIQTEYGQAKAYWNYSEILLKMNKFAEAKKYVDSAIFISKKGGFLEFQKNSYHTAFKIDSAIGDYHAALKHYILYSQTKDSIINENSKKQIANLESVYKLKQKEKENELLKIKQEHQNEVIKRQRIITTFASIAILLFLIIVFILYRLNRVQKKYNIELEQKNNEILLQKEELLTQNEQIEQQRSELDKYYRRMSDSVKYAQRIQNAMLSDISKFESIFKEYFLIYLPKDVVSGDFYLLFELESNKKLVAVGDSTGHGVPGAFMSILNMSILREIIHFYKDYTAAQMLNLARDFVIEVLSKHQNSKNLRDGMDIALLIIDKKQKTINFAAANRPLLYIQNNQLNIIKGDKQPVAEYIVKKDFTDNYIDYQVSTIFYISSDGYYDQMSEKEGTKFYFKNFKKLLEEIFSLPMEKQKEILLQKLEQHKGNSVFTDDITVLGFKL